VWLDHWAVGCLAPLAVWILLSGLDDLFIALVRLLTARKPFPWPSEEALDAAAERPIAIFLPLWREHAVVGQMLDRNLAAIRYRNYHIFAGVYPNDELTVRAVESAASRHAQVHVARCPHGGPTSKGDCLNWIHRRMLQYEAAHGVRFEVVMTHDAEDVIHAESLRLVNWFSRDYDMVQIPVLALPTALREFTHGLYCDEFAEFQQKDIPARQSLGGFLPSNGVGTGFGRSAIERLAAMRGGRVFDPECLTEDYETGYALHSLGCRQIFVPLRRGEAGPVATREYFPRSCRPAVRQRSRWVAGIALQGWERHGWRAPWPQLYWFWRDRKGLVGNLVTPLAALLLVYGMVHWRSGVPGPAWLPVVCGATFLISLLQMGLRAFFSARIYGWRFAAAVPLRMLWGNVVNYAATYAALREFAAARLQGHALAWRKTQHAYPAHRAPEPGRPRVGEVLARIQALDPDALEQALASQPEGVRLGEHLVRLRKLSEKDLYRALSIQAGLPLGAPAPGDVNRLATRTLPAAAMRRWRVMPYRVDLGQLHLATAEVPSEEMARDLASFSSLELRYRLVQPREFEKLAAAYWPKGGG
jgi:bacteriophage N4 adsorption protein B